MRVLRAALFVGFAAIPVYAAVASWSLMIPPPWTYPSPALPDSFEVFYAQRLAESRAAGVWPGAEERLVRRAPGRTPYAILYIHGFGASRGEGEFVADSVSALLGANLYYLRLPGHGTNLDDHARTPHQAYLSTVEDAFRMMPRLGERVILIGTSAGALLATGLAARHPDSVHAMILASPMYAFYDRTSVLLALPGGLRFIEATRGEIRDTRDRQDPEHRLLPGQERVWLRVQRYESLVQLDRVRRRIARLETFRRITAPTLLFHFWRDEAVHDTTASVVAMRNAFDQFGRASRPSPHNRVVAVGDGAHVLFSELVRTDKAAIFVAIRRFLADLEAGA